VSILTPVPLRRLKYAATINYEALGEDTDPDYVLQYVDIGNVDSSGVIHEIVEYRFADAPSRARRRVRDGDVIISCVRTYLQAIASIKEPPDNLIVSTGFAVVRPQTDVFDPAFGKYALREMRFLAEVEKRSVGVSYPAINASDLANISIHLPHIQQQRTIADYLDRETSRIDALIAAKGLLLDLLAEKCRALITCTVTRGLDPNFPMCDSGIPWIDRIPMHWNILKLKQIASLKSGEFITADSISDEGEYPVFGGNGLRGYTTAYTHNGDHILIGRQGALCGNINYASGRFWASEHAVVVTVNKGHEVRWLGKLLEIMNLNQYSQSAAQPGLAVEFIANLSLPVPPDLEQRAIVSFIQDAMGRIDAIVAGTKQTIELLKERRTALITAAVTGQTDIGGIA